MPNLTRLRPRKVPTGRLRRELLDALLDDFPTTAERLAMGKAGTYDVWYEFDFGLRELAALRVEHRETLMREAERRGLGAEHLDRVRAKCDDEWRLSLPETEH